MEDIILGILYLLIVNIIAFIMYGIDKNKAKRHAYRIPEKTLIIIAVIGGSIGAYLGMKIFSHKTRHPRFYIGIPVIIVVQILLLVSFWYGKNYF